MKMKWPSFAVLLFAAALSTSAQVPTMMSYQGRLAANGSNYNGTARFKFSLVSPDGFTTYWSNDNSATGGLEPTMDVAVAVSNGLFTVFLGDTTLPGMGAELDPAIFQENDDAYLRIWVSDGVSAFVRLMPDQPLGSVGYAMMATMAAGVANGAVGVDQLDDGAVTSNKMAAGAVANAQLATGAVTSNKIDWSTMPVIPELRGYDESGAFDVPPSATGDNAIALGYNSVADGDYAAVGGGRDNMASGADATAGGGQQNTVNGDHAVVGGGAFNSANSEGAAVVGGAYNSANGAGAAVVGGQNNAAAASAAFVGGGSDNAANNGGAAVVGGQQNLASGSQAFVGGGLDNSAEGYETAVVGGEGNRANGTYALVGGG